MAEKFGDYHEISAKIIPDDDDTNPFRGNTLIQIIHNNIWKDVWIIEGKIDQIIYVYPDCMGRDELNIWKTLCEKRIVK